MINLKILTLSFASLFLINNIAISSEIEQDNKLSTKERLAIIKNEKVRLNKIEYRKQDIDDLSLNKNYIRNTLYNDHIKNLMREASFYMDFIIKNSENKDNLKKEYKNMAWNAICLSGLLKDDSEVVFNMLQVTLFDEGTKEEESYLNGNKLVLDIFNESDYNPSKEEINLRCYEFYESEITNKKV